MQSSFMNALKGENAKSPPPIWLMRQAGRYLPQYRELRAKHSFMDMCHNPELIAEVTLLPFASFPFDAAILFSDILLITQAFGYHLRFEEKVGPLIDPPVSSAKEVLEMRYKPIAEVLGCVAEGIRHVKPQLNVPLMGFCGAPFTVASYMIEGKSERDLKKTKRWMWQQPDSFHLLLDKIADASIDYLRMQIEAGVDAIQIFDSWANVLSPGHFREFALPPLKKILKALQPLKKPIIFFSRGTGGFLDDLISLSPSVISVDWNVDIGKVRHFLPKHIGLQGNLDPYVLYGDEKRIRKEVCTLLETMKGDPSYIFNLGHGILPDIPLESVRIMVECVKGFKSHDQNN